MNFKKILFSLKSKKTKQHENKNETTFSKMDNNSSNKVSYIDELKDKYRKNNYNNIPLYFYREYGINANESIKKLQNYRLLSTEKRLTSDGKRLLKIKQKLIYNHKSDKTWSGIGPVKYHYDKVKEAEEQENLNYIEYLDEKIKQYFFLATLDIKTCSICGNLDGKIFDIKDKKTGINYPLIHPGCRCTTTPYFHNMPTNTTRWARNPITGKGEYINNINFNEWKKIYF
ncbi:minor capsid protein [Lactobacillus sp. ESL0259]|uniref:minor capsid protein n=1 Tax=Lactobacillus sp. ESL0259 TaxID=2069346 RepID=UPI000EFD28AC|nr:minor capsid protein [Lactobacillus sp. ESL0259]RMC60547.1 hypothetical protein F5ESL0259_05860 [Lactobacillus sp. ESL0259]